MKKLPLLRPSCPTCHSFGAVTVCQYRGCPFATYCGSTPPNDMLPVRCVSSDKYTPNKLFFSALLFFINPITEFLAADGASPKMPSNGSHLNGSGDCTMEVPGRGFLSNKFDCDNIGYVQGEYCAEMLTAMHRRFLHGAWAWGTPVGRLQGSPWRNQLCVGSMTSTAFTSIFVHHEGRARARGGTRRPTKVQLYSDPHRRRVLAHLLLGTETIVESI